MSSPAEVLWNFLGHLSQTTAQHVGKRLDRAAGFQPAPPPWAAGPNTPGPQWAPMPAPPVPPVLAAGVSGGTGAMVATLPPSPWADPRDAVTGSYSDQVAQGVACLACTRGHLNGLLAAVEQAQAAIEAGQDEDARKYYARAAAEIDAMMVIDWAPEKLAATPPDEVAVIEAIRACVTEIRAQIPTPKGLGLALGSATENVRFAVSPTVTDRDRAEIEARLRIIDKEGNALERGPLLEVEGPEAEDAATALREARHTLDRAKSQGALYAVATHKQTVQDLEAAAVALTPAPDADQLAALGTLCQSCSETFYEAYFRTDQEDHDA